MVDHAGKTPDIDTQAPSAVGFSASSAPPEPSPALPRDSCDGEVTVERAKDAVRGKSFFSNIFSNIFLIFFVWEKM